MAQHEYVCQSCIHKKICPEYHEQTYSCVNHLDEADVAPRAEVAREIFEEIERNIINLETPYQILHCIPQDYISAIKKKYTGDA